MAQTPAASNSDILTTEERAWLAAHPILRLSPHPDYQPIDFFDEQGQHRGLTADYLALLEQRLGVHFQIVRVDLSNKQLDLDNPAELGADIKVAITQTPERLDRWLFTKPYLEIPAYIITRKEANDALTLQHLEGNRVAVIWHYAARQYLATNYPKLIPDPVLDTRTGLRKVSFGLVDAFVSELPASTYWMEREGITNLKIAGETEYIYRLGIATRKDWPELNRILDKGLAQITPEERAAIYQKWVKMPLESSPFSRRLGLTLLAGVSVIGLGLLGALLWNRSLSAQVRRQTAELQQELKERQEAEQALQQSEKMFRSLTETTSAWVFIEQNGLCCYLNAAGEKGIGYTRAELATMNVWTLVHPDDQAWIKARGEARRQGLSISPTIEMRVLTKAGEVRWVQVTTTPIEYRGAIATLGTAFDITKHKQAEEQLEISAHQLHQLAGYLQTIREEERTAMAREIHDELGQSLTAMKMDLVWLNQRLREAGVPLQERIATTIGLANDTINTVRKLATQLRPGILDDLGLTAALEWQAQEFQARTGIACEFVCQMKIDEVEAEHATAIFRICQEALTNVARHADATHVSINLQVAQNDLMLEVRDNGRGMTDGELANLRSLGLMGMRERAFLLGGEFHLTSNSTQGITATARIPLSQAKAKGGIS